MLCYIQIPQLIRRTPHHPRLTRPRLMQFIHIRLGGQNKGLPPLTTLCWRRKLRGMKLIRKCSLLRENDAGSGDPPRVHPHTLGGRSVLVLVSGRRRRRRCRGTWPEASVEQPRLLASLAIRTTLPPFGLRAAVRSGLASQLAAALASSPLISHLMHRHRSFTSFLKMFDYR